MATATATATTTTTLLHRLGIRYPILLAPMAGVSTPQLAAEVSNAGSLGSLGLGAATKESALEQVLVTQKLTPAPFQLNFFCHESVKIDSKSNTTWANHFSSQFSKYGSAPPSELQCIYPSFKDNDAFLDICIKTTPKAVSFHFGIPHPHQIEALKSNGIITMVSATNLSEAIAIEKAGIDIIIANGIEAGGHRGIFNQHIDGAIPTSDLVFLIKQHCSLPVIAAGGIMNGQQAKAIMKIGADAVQMGTAFVQCSSSNANQAYREALFAKHPITQITSSLSGRPARGLINKWQLEIDTPDRPTVAPYPYAYDLAKQLNMLAVKQGETGYGAFWAGSNVSQIRKLEAQNLVKVLIEEMELCAH